MRFALAAASFIGLVAATPLAVPNVWVGLSYPDGTFSNAFPVPSDGKPYLHASKGPVSAVFVNAYYDGTKYHETECTFFDADGKIVKAVAVYKPTLSDATPNINIQTIACNIGN